MPELVCAADDPRWLTERRRGVTATDITAIVGLSLYESAYSLFFKKRGDIPDEHNDNDRLRLGRELEPIIMGRWQEQHNVQVNKGFSLTGDWLDDGGPVLYRNSTRPWQLATPDATVKNRKTADARDVPVAVIELKSWADADRDRWADGPPARVHAQVLWQMDTLDVATGHVGVLFLPSGEFRSYVIAHEDEKMHDELGPEGCPVCMDQRLLREAGRDFMDRLDHGDPPSPDASSATLAALKARFADPLPGKEAEIDAGAWATYAVILDNIEREKLAKQIVEATIREQAGEARTLTVNGTKVATRIVSDSEVKAHTRHSDYIRRAASKGESE